LTEVVGVSDLAEPPLSVAETCRRLPSIDLIQDDDIRSEVIDLSRFAPEYFWQRPGSKAGYHNPDRHGLWAHTLKLSTIVERLAESRVRQTYLRPEDVDKVHAAAVLHDQRKEGDEAGETRSDHDLVMGEVIREESSLSDAVARAVEEHMGPWYDGPTPSSEISRLLHDADMIAATQEIDVRVVAPAPEEILAAGYGEVEIQGGGRGE
jgi:hypothetical protein